MVPEAKGIIELRKDPIVDRWVAISSQRAKRPSDFKTPTEEEVRAENCPFCEGHEAMTPPEIVAYRVNDTGPDTPGWTVRVVPNKYPALSAKEELSEEDDGLYHARGGVGAHEVIVESPRHCLEVTELSVDELAGVYRCYKDRLIALSEDKRLKYVMIFKNHGRRAGASLQHTHSQVIALPIVPRLLTSEIAGASRYFEGNGKCIYCDIIERELSDRSRVVIENDSFLVICPYAPRHPFETCILPKRHCAAFENISEKEINDMAKIFKDLLGRYMQELKNPPFNYMLHTLPFRNGHKMSYHWHIELTPVLTRLAGFEKGTGYYINAVPPESAAHYLRELAAE